MNKLKAIIAVITGSKKSKKPSKSNNTATKSPSTHTHITTSDLRIVQNFRLIWLDNGIDEVYSDDSINTIIKLREVVNTINKFTDLNECIQFITGIEDEKAFVITSASLGQDLVPNIHDLPQVDAIYIFCGNKSSHEQWTKEWIKIKGIHTDITPICQALQQAAKRCNQDCIGMSFVSVGEGATNANLNQLEPSFMYSQIFKEILLEMEHDEKSINDLATYCRQFYHDNMRELEIIYEFEHDYRSKSPIGWYTRECFVYQMLNRALRTLEGDTIINMGFFIRDLHEQIQQLYQQQVGSYHEKSFTVYRGQGLLKTDFEKLVQTKGGLMSFNNFLSTSTKREVSLDFAKDALTKTNMVGILFKLTIDPSVSSAPFASIQDVSYFQTEEEILFSMHTVFRVGEIIKMDNNSLLYQVGLKITADDDQQLRILTQSIREEVASATGWQRLVRLLLKLSQFDKAEKLCNALLEQTSDGGEKAIYYNQLGYIKSDQGDYHKAIEYYEKALEIRQEILPPYHPSLAISYNNIGFVYKNMREYSTALSFYEKAREIQEKTLSPNHPDLATSYNNIGGVYDNNGECSKALSFYEKALQIRENILPPNHPDFAQSYNNIAGVYYSMREYSKALSYYEHALKTFQSSLPSNHPNIKTVEENIVIVKKKL
jgi:Tfp pilus assembly protein PilF